jgi:hypothetical protein
MISVVNGYVCFSSCDAATARQRQNPAANTGPNSGASNGKTSGLDNRRVTVYDGALKDFTDTPAAAKTSGATPVVPQQKVNLLI